MATPASRGIYMGTLPRYILMEHLRGSFFATAPQTEQSEVEEGMVAKKLYVGQRRVLVGGFFFRLLIAKHSEALLAK